MPGAWASGGPRFALALQQQPRCVCGAAASPRGSPSPMPPVETGVAHCKAAAVADACCMARAHGAAPWIGWRPQAYIAGGRLLIVQWQDTPQLLHNGRSRYPYATQVRSLSVHRSVGSWGGDTGACCCRHSASNSPYPEYGTRPACVPNAANDGDPPITDPLGAERHMHEYLGM